MTVDHRQGAEKMQPPSPNIAPPARMSASETLRLLANTHPKDVHVSLDEILTTLGSGSFAIVLIVLATPAGLPFPAPWGITQLFSLLIMLVSLQVAIGRHHLWLPGWMKRRRIKGSLLHILADKGGALLQKIEALVKPRFPWMHSWAMQRITGLLCALCAVSAALPIPLTNTLPSAGIVLMAMAMMEHDGLLLLAGVAVGMVGLALSTAVLVLGHEVVTTTLSALFGV